jgi:hypothetical protein
MQFCIGDDGLDKVGRKSKDVPSLDIGHKDKAVRTLRDVLRAALTHEVHGFSIAGDKNESHTEITVTMKIGRETNAYELKYQLEGLKGD